MEFPLDWRELQEFFYPRLNPSTQEPIWAITTKEKKVDLQSSTTTEESSLVSAYSGGEDFSDWFDQPLKQLRNQYKGRKIYEIDRLLLDSLIEKSIDSETASTGHEALADQLIRLEKNVGNQTDYEFRTHFLLKSLLGIGGKVLPSLFGIYIRIETEYKHRDLLVVFRKGKIKGAFVPEFKGISPERAKKQSEVVSFLQDLYGLPVQGFFTTEACWCELAQSSNPFKLLRKYIKLRKTRLLPYRFSFSGLMWLKSLT